MSNIEINNLEIAMILGDGHISKNGRLQIQHSLKQEDYLLYKVNVLETFGNKCKYDNKSYYDSRPGKNKTYHFIDMWTTVTFKWKQMRELIYADGTKQIPDGLVDEFSFKEWAILYQDDGRCNKISHYNTIKDGNRVSIECEPYVNRYEIYTNAFNDQSIEYLQNNLLSLGIESNKLKLKQGGYSIAISKAESKVKFYEGIKQYIIDAMNYKVSIKPTMGYKCSTCND